VEEEGGDWVAEGGELVVVVDVGEALLIKGSSASISSPPKGADSTGLLLYKSIIVAAMISTLTKKSKDF
jgi:hypothetical protein